MLQKNLKQGSKTVLSFELVDFVVCSNIPICHSMNLFSIQNGLVVLASFTYKQAPKLIIYFEGTDQRISECIHINYGIDQKHNSLPAIKLFHVSPKPMAVPK